MSKASNTQCWRLLDTGIRRAAENFAMNRAILEAHQQGGAPHTLRFLGFTPAALIGFHQDVEQELNLDYIHAHGIDVQRRLSGGGAIYFDQQQFGWELYLDRQLLGGGDMGQIARRICETVAGALQGLGVDARFRPRNDIEVEGRKISGTGGYFDGNSFLYQGTLLVDFDVETMMRVLRIPAEKLNDKALADARQRVVTLRELLGEQLPSMELIKQAIADALAVEFATCWEASNELNPLETQLYREALAEIDSAEWVYQHNRPLSDAPLREGLHRVPGGLLRTSVIYDARKQRIKQVWLTGDFFVKPRRLIVDLEAALRDSPRAELAARIEGFFARAEVETLQLGAEDFILAINAAIDGAT